MDLPDPFDLISHVPVQELGKNRHPIFIRLSGPHIDHIPIKKYKSIQCLPLGRGGNVSFGRKLTQEGVDLLLLTMLCEY